MTLPKLTDEQRHALRGLEWFIEDDNARAGRTFTMAVAAVRIALRNPDREVNLIDHRLGEAGQRAMLSTVAAYLDVTGFAPWATLSERGTLAITVPAESSPAWGPYQGNRDYVLGL